MPILQHGAFEDLEQTATADPEFLGSGPEGEGEALYAVSAERRGLALRSIKLTKDFGWLADLFNPSKQIYFISYAWDLSGQPVEIYPPAVTGLAADTLLLQLREQEVRSFIGDGVTLFQPRKVTAGINLCLHLFESNQDTRRLGETLVTVTQTIQNSSLNKLLSTLAMVTPAQATVLAKEATLELFNAIGAVLKTGRDSHLDFFQGTYNVASPWSPGNDAQAGSGAELVLSRLV